MRSTLLRHLLALAIGTTAPAAFAGPYSDLIIFGDSLSDTGNVLSLTKVFTPATPFPIFPGAEGRFSNGPVWVETLASGLGLDSAAGAANKIYNGTSVLPLGAPAGNNYAYGGARTGLGGSAGGTTGLVGQLINWNGGAFSPATGLSRAADPNALYVVVAGGNDLRDGRSGNAADRTAAATTAAQNVVNSLGLLAQAGARHFLIASMPDLGGTPEAHDLNLVAESTDITVKFNTALGLFADGLDANFLAATGIDLDIREVDLFGLGQRVVDDARSNGGKTYGITNVDTPCINPLVNPVNNQKFYFVPGVTTTACGSAGSSDDLHPSAALHRLIGQQALAVAVPEPAPLALLAAALLSLALVRRRAR
jgi:outer membrane lipase/esterase